MQKKGLQTFLYSTAGVIGLAIILMVFRNRATLQIDDFDTLKN